MSKEALAGQQKFELQPTPEEIHTLATERLHLIERELLAGRPILSRDVVKPRKSVSEHSFSTDTMDDLAIMDKVKAAANANQAGGGAQVIKAKNARQKQLVEDAHKFEKQALAEQQMLEPLVMPVGDEDIPQMLPFHAFGIEHYSDNPNSDEQILLRAARAFDAYVLVNLQVDRKELGVIEKRLKNIDLYGSTHTQDDEEFIYLLSTNAVFNTENRIEHWKARAFEIEHFDTRKIGNVATSMAASTEDRERANFIDQQIG